jgi:intracellular sulfur oxidation DsrE/DsrF family protein
MNQKRKQSRLERRSFLARLGTGIGVAGVAAFGAPRGSQAATDAPWRPVDDSQDEWLDDIPGRHRFVFDATTADGLGMALRFANNYFEANERSYGLKNSDLAVVIIMRHRATPFGFSNTIWAKYGKQLTDQAEFSDPKTGQPFTTHMDDWVDRIFTRTSLGNVFVGDNTGSAELMSGLIKRGAHFALCQMSALSVCGIIARATGGNAETVYKQFAANLIPNARIVPAGIVAVNRAQEHGYSYVYTG